MKLRKGLYFKQILMVTLLIAVVVFLGGCGEKTYHVGILSGLDFVAGSIDGFKAKMTELGYIEGKNITYDIKKSNFDIAVYQSNIKKFVEDKVDLIYVYPTEASLEAKTLTEGTDIPIVFSVANIENNNLIKSITEPGGNVTGVRFPGPEIAVKRFEIMHEMAPQAKRYWLPYQRGYPIIPAQMDLLRPVAEAAGITLIEAPADSAAELDSMLQAKAKSGNIDFDAIMFLVDPIAVTPDAFVVMAKFANEHKIPIDGVFISVGEYSTGFGVNIEPIATGKQAATLADKIFKGAKAGTIPVISSENYIEINYDAAQKQGLTVSDSVLSQANKVVR